jgi:hypothetical protein
MRVADERNNAPNPARDLILAQIGCFAAENTEDDQ